MKKSVKILIIVLSSILAVILAGYVTVVILSTIGKNQLLKNDKNIVNVNVTVEEDGIVYKDHRYKLNPNIITILLIGIDKEGVNGSSNINGLSGQADTLLVAAIDTETKELTIIPVSRETLTDVNLYDISGNYVGVENKQVCLAYAYGKDVKQSSENVLLSVSRILFGINISSYVTMDLDALEKLSDSVGSIEVYVNETYYDPDSGIYYKEGRTIKVKGRSAVNYIHWRTDDVYANNFRMERQRSFMTAFMNKVADSVSKDYSKVVSYYNMMQPYISTNITLPQTTYLATTCLKLRLGDSMQFKTVPGETAIVNGFSAFTPDYDALTDIVIDTFYNKIS
ncbi:MAG: LCP family protein [Clostridia bacterium]|nr:LCP family protein [Clostridia bacterium]